MYFHIQAKQNPQMGDEFSLSLGTPKIVIKSISQFNWLSKITFRQVRQCDEKKQKTSQLVMNKE